MITITFSAIKGGVGKSSLAVITANALLASGYKVLVLDADPQNSTTSYYFPEQINDFENSNLADVIGGELLSKNMIKTRKHYGKEEMWLVPSSLDLLKQRYCAANILQGALSAVDVDFDYCIIDTAPTFDSVVINCLNAADMVITPVQLTGFDLKSAIFYKKQMSQMAMLDKWYIMFNKFRPLRSTGGVAGKLYEIYTSGYFSNIIRTTFPESAAFRNYIETNTTISKAKDKQAAFSAVYDFVRELTLGNELSMAECDTAGKLPAGSI